VSAGVSPILVNGTIAADLTNAVLDPLESPQINPPALGVSHCLINVLKHTDDSGSPSRIVLPATLFPQGFVRVAPLLDYNQPSDKQS